MRRYLAVLAIAFAIPDAAQGKKAKKEELPGEKPEPAIVISCTQERQKKGSEEFLILKAVHPYGYPNDRPTANEITFKLYKNDGKTRALFVSNENYEIEKVKAGPRTHAKSYTYWFHCWRRTPNNVKALIENPHETVYNPPSPHTKSGPHH